jgi:serine/threonine protein phosphatase PrpC
MSKLLVGSATDVGLVRSNNQDQLLVVSGLYAVADGMGGHAAGEVASATAVRALRAAFEASDERSARSLLNAANAANRAVWEQAQAHRAMHGMGTTLVALAVVEREDGTNGLAIAHIGDSRAYRYRDGQLTQLTVDHSYVQELVDDGQISQAQAAVHPQRHVLTRALGVEPSVDIDLLALEPRHGDRYLLCSDGLPREAIDAEIASVLGRFPDPSEAANELIALANSRGGSDNITVVVVDVLANGATPEAVITLNASTEGQSGAGDLDGTAPVQTPIRARLQTPAHPGSRRSAVATAARPIATEPATKLVGAPEADQAWPGSGEGLAPTRSRLLTWRLASFVTAVIVVVGGAIGALAWYARSSYFVSVSRGKITIFQGRPGGVLWFQPTLAERTSYTTSSVLPYELVELRAGQLEPSLGRAREYISNLVAEKVEAERAVPSYAKGAPRPGVKATKTTKATNSRAGGATRPTRTGGTTSAP